MHLSGCHTFRKSLDYCFSFIEQFGLMSLFWDILCYKVKIGSRNLLKVMFTSICLKVELHWTLSRLVRTPLFQRFLRIMLVDTGWWFVLFSHNGSLVFIHNPEILSSEDKRGFREMIPFITLDPPLPSHPPLAVWEQVWTNLLKYPSSSTLASLLKIWGADWLVEDNMGIKTLELNPVSC
jgi:hypothetical protein